MNRSISLFTFLLLPLTALAADADKPATPAPPAAAAADAKVHAPTDLAALKPLKGQKIVIEGKIANAGANKTESIRYLNFTKNFRESVSLVFFVERGGGTFTKEKLAEYVGKTVRANGALSEFNEALQIKIESLDQIKVIEAPATTPPPAAPAK